MRPSDAASLLETLRKAMRQRWRRGEPAFVEEYLTAHPELAHDDEVLLDFLYAEFCIREAAGQTPPVDEYFRRFPHLQASLQTLFEVHAALGVESPLTVDWDSHSTGESLATKAPEPLADGAAPPSQFGDYDLLAPIGRGGMGMVYMARQRSLDRLVALKMIRSGELATEAEVQRFIAEAHAAARLKHPAIVPVYEAGEVGGRHYYSMELIEGCDLASLVRERPFEPRRAARCLDAVATAVHYAHSMGVLHRDLKPANILLDGADQVYITDFGLARRLDVSEGATASGQLLGTPNYMPPEQAQGHTHRLGPASDVYSLGAIFYELLTGRPPFQAATLLETLKLVVETPPVAPRRLNAAIPRDAETICLKCLEKSPVARYQTAQEVADDLQRFLDGEPIRARPASTVEKVIKWARRRPWQARLLAVAALAAVTLFATVTVYNKYLSDALRRAETNEQIAIDQTRLAERRLDRATRSLFALQLQRAAAMVDREPAAARELLLDPERCPVALRDFLWRYLERRSQRQTRVVAQHANPVRCMDVDRTGRYIAWGDAQGTVVVQSLLDKGQRRVIAAHSAAVNALVFLGSGAALATAGEDRVVRLWDTATGASLAHLDGHHDNVNALASSSNGEQLVSGGADGAVLVWDVVQRRQVRSLSKHPNSVFALAFAPDDRTIASAGKEGTVRLEDETGEVRRLEGHEGAVTCLAFSRGGVHLATGGVDRTLRLWQVESGMLEATLPGHDGVVASLVLSPNGERLASAGYDGAVKIWDAASGQLLTRLAGHADQVWSVVFGPTGETLFSASKDQTVRAWSVDPPDAGQTLAAHTRPATAIAFSADDRNLLTASYDQTVRLWELPAAKPDATFHAASSWISSLALVGSPRMAAIGASDGTLYWWDLSRAEPHEALVHELGVTVVAARPQGDLVFTASADGTGRLWKTGQLEPFVSLEPGAAETLTASFTEDGQWLATGYADGVVAVWSVADWRRQAVWPAHAGETRCVTFLGDGQQLATGGSDGLARVWNWWTHAQLAELRGSERSVLALAASPDGKVLVSGGEDGVVRFWDPVIGEQRGVLQPGMGAVTSLAFSRDGQWLAAAGGDGRVRLWRDPKPTSQARQ